MSDNFENNTNGFDSADSQQEEQNAFSSEPAEQEAQSNPQASTPFGFESGEFFFDSPRYDTEKSPDTEEKPEPDEKPEKPVSTYQTPSYFNVPQNPNAYYQFGRQQVNYSAPSPDYNDGKKSSKGKTVAVIIIVAAIVVGLFTVVSSMFSDNGTDTPQVNTTASTTEAPTVAANNGAQGGSDQLQYSTTDEHSARQLSAVEVGKKARKSVVGVMTYKNGQLSGEGSGVVMSVDSTNQYTYIITCAHVINEKGVTYGVLTLEGKRYEARLVAADSKTDIGVLKVEATDLPVAEFGDSTTLEVGETVYAIGNPGGSEYFGSMTDGIVSAMDRSINNTYNMTCIQHNAAINPGNSGGALVNSAGQVIGINSSKIAATDYEGMGFAIPMSIAKPIVDNLIQYGYVPNRPKLGIEYASVSDYQLYSMVVAIRGLPSESLVIAGISTDSSLANTDAQVGDLIVGVNGRPMNSSDTLLDLISTGNVGDTLTLNLCRVDNRTYQITEFDVTITLVEDRGDTQEEETTAAPSGGYNYGGAGSFEDFFNDYFGSFIR